MPVTTTSEEWSALAERAEAATAPDRELDRAITAARRGAGLWKSPHYTGSVDDAMMLVPEGWNWSVTGFDQTPAEAWVENAESTFIGEGLCRNPKKRCLWACAATPALALLAACCRAQADLAVQS